jgi:acetyl-CoA C-acetyltransferase
MEQTPVLVDGARTAIGRFNGMHAELDACQLGARAVAGALERVPGFPPDYIVLGNVIQAGNGQNPARKAAVLGGVARDVPALTLNDVCLASMTSVRIAAAMVSSGEATNVLVGGFESMTRAPHLLHLQTTGQQLTREADLIDSMEHDGLTCSLDGVGVGMGPLSDQANSRLCITREAQDALALESHRRAQTATRNGRLSKEITTTQDAAHDEGIRPDTSIEKLSALSPAFTADGTITAGNASQLSDAGAAGIVSSLERAEAEGIKPLAEIVGHAVVAGIDSTLHHRPADAARLLLQRHGLTVADVDLWEINEAFACVVLASMAQLGLDPSRVNVNGGAIALGHPLAASGFRLVLTLAYEMRDRQLEHGVAAICGGGGQGQAVLLRSTG